MEDKNCTCNLENQMISDSSQNSKLIQDKAETVNPARKGNEGFGIVEVVLIIVVVIGLVIIFNEQITTFMNSALEKLQSTANDII